MSQVESDRQVTGPSSATRSVLKTSHSNNIALTVCHAHLLRITRPPARLNDDISRPRAHASDGDIGQGYPVLIHPGHNGSKGVVRERKLRARRQPTSTYRGRSFTYLNVLRRIRHKTNPVIQIQLTARLPIPIQRHDQTPRIQPRRLRRVPRLLHRHNISAPDMHRLMHERRIQRLVLACRHLDLLQRVEVVPDRAVCDTWEDSLHARRQRRKDWRDEQCGTSHELSLDCLERGIVRKLPRQSAEDGFAGDVGAVEERVGVGKQAIADVHDAASRFGRRGPAICFLGDGVA